MTTSYNHTHHVSPGTTEAPTDWRVPEALPAYGTESSSGDFNLRDKFDNDPHNGDWRDDLLVIIGVVCLLAFFSVISLASLTHREDVLFYIGITTLVLGIYVRVAGKRGR